MFCGLIWIETVVHNLGLLIAIARQNWHTAVTALRSRGCDKLQKWNIFQSTSVGREPTGATWAVARKMKESRASIRVRRLACVRVKSRNSFRRRSLDLVAVFTLDSE